MPQGTPSPRGRTAVGYFGLAQTPAVQGAHVMPATPISGAMSSAKWLQDLAAVSPQQVRSSTQPLWPVCSEMSVTPASANDC